MWFYVSSTLYVSLVYGSLFTCHLHCDHTIHCPPTDEEQGNYATLCRDMYICLCNVTNSTKESYHQVLFCGVGGQLIHCYYWYKTQFNSRPCHWRQLSFYKKHCPRQLLRTIFFPIFWWGDKVRSVNSAQTMFIKEDTVSYHRFYCPNTLTFSCYLYFSLHCTGPSAD